MKKILSLILVVSTAIALVACGGTSASSDKEQVENQAAVVEKDAENVAVEENEDTEVTGAEEGEKVEWKEFLEEYEAWVDDYIEITKKYKNNPSDVTILSDYTSMMTEMADWTTKTEDMEKELEEASPDELIEYSAELVRIAAKLADVAY